VSVYLNIIQIIVAVALMALVVMQSKEAGAARMFGGDSSIHRTRRGVEKTMYHLTIMMSAVFFVMARVNVLFG